MPKGVEQNQLDNSGTGQATAKSMLGNAGSIYGTLDPTLSAEAAHPSGYSPTQLAAINTGAQQSAGGSQAGTVGEGGLYAARTKNAGAAQAAIGAGTRSAGANLSNAAVGTATDNANLEQKQQQEGLSGLGGLYKDEVSGGEGALGLSNSALSGADESASNNPWMKLLMQGTQSGGQVASAGFGAGGAWS